MQGFPQYLAAPTPALTTPMPSQFGAPRLPHPMTQWGSSVNFTAGASSSAVISRAYVLPSADGREQGDVVTGMISVDLFVAHALFDSGTSYSFVLENFVSRAGLSMRRLGHLILVSSANGSISSCLVCQGCSIILADEAFSANLVVISFGAFDVILGMDWLSQYRQLYPIFGRQCYCRRRRVGRWYSWDIPQSSRYPCWRNCFWIAGEGSRESFSPRWWRVRLPCGCRTSGWCVTLPTYF
jgi:hypothetical protein